MWSSDNLGNWLLLLLVLGHSNLLHRFYGAKWNCFDVFAVMIPILYQVQLKGMMFFNPTCVAQVDKRVS